MARMIPSQIDPETHSAAEKKVFRLLQNMPDTEDWCVMHSVGVARHPTQSQGEGDFTVLIPGMGAFVLEVKGGGISYRDGRWYSRDRFGVEHPIKNPVAEANNAMQGLRDYVERNNDTDLHYSLFGFGVVFPDATVHGCFSIPDIDDKQIADVDDMANLRGYLLRLAEYCRSRRTGRVYLPKKQQTDAIVRLLRPNHQFRTSVASQIRNVERQAIALTENQQEVFEGLLDNERCLVRGSAGTGKTVLAVECARHWARQGLRVGLFCYNRQLGEWLKENLAADEGVVCDSFLDYMETQLGPSLTDDAKQARSREKSRYYDELLPSLFEEAIIDEKTPRFDCIIVDEAQDLFRPRWLETIDLLLKEGLAEGNWYFFMDAENQNLYHNAVTYDDAAGALRQRKAHYAKYRLRDNCRNSQAIIEKVNEIFGTRTAFRSMEYRGADVVMQPYRREKDQLTVLQNLLDGLKRDGVRPDDMVLLSTVRLENSVAGGLQDEHLSTDRTDRENRLLFSTIHSFKGLESPVVILLDFDELEHAQRKHLLYVGMTRARSALYVVLSEKAQRSLQKINQEVKPDV